MPEFEEYYINVKATPPIYPGAQTQPWILWRGDFPRWRQTILDLLHDIASTKTGMALLRTTQRTKRWILIQPPDHWNVCNSSSGGSNVTGPDGKPYSGRTSFDPAMYMYGSPCYELSHSLDPSKYGERPDEVLCHELFHAHRKTLNIDRWYLTGGLKRYDHQEDFLAVTITNVYGADWTNRHGSGLRRDHKDHARLEANLSGSIKFFNSSPLALLVMTNFSIEEPFLFRQLAAVKSSFNPFEALLNHGPEVARNSVSRIALEREVSIPREPVRPRPQELPSLTEYLATKALRRLMQ